MKNLNDVKIFYQNVQMNKEFDYGKIAGAFGNHDIFANPPQLREVHLPFFGEVELGLTAIKVGNYTALRDVAIDDGKYSYKSEVVFIARQNDTLQNAGYKQANGGVFDGMVILSCNQSYHGNLFGHPATYSRMSHDRTITRHTRTVEEFCVDVLPRLVKNAISRFYPESLHEFPFDDGDFVEVMAKDTTKIGGYTRHCKAASAFEVFCSMRDSIYSKERGNVHISGHIKAGNVLFIIPAFGKNHVAFATAV